MSYTGVLLLIIVVYASGLWLLARTSIKKKQTMNYYHVSDRNVGWAVNSLSIASAWVWAPALFVASTQAFTNGWVGAAWFIVPNAAALALMLPFALKIRQKYPKGFTLSGLMRRRYGRATQNWYLGGMGGLSMLAVSVNLLAVGTVLSLLTGLPLIVTAVFFLVLVMAYTYRYGIRAAFITEVAQIIFIVTILVILVPVTVSITGWDAVSAGFHGINHITGFFSASGVEVAATFGIISAIGLAAGPVGDQAFWQRAFASRPKDVVKSCGLGAVWFTIIPLLMTVFGFVAVGTAFKANNQGYVNLELVQSMFPVWVAVPFMLMLCAALFSTINSHLISLSTLSGDKLATVGQQRTSMTIIAVAGFGIAIIPGNSVAAMFLIYSTLRSSTFLITITTLMGKQWNWRATSWGIGTGVIVGFPLAVYSNLIVDDWPIRLFAIGFTTLAPILVVAVWTAIIGATGDREPEHLTATEITARKEQVLVE